MHKARSGSTSLPAATAGLRHRLHPPALGRVRRRYPRLQVELITATRQLALRPSDFDPALVIGVPSSSRLVTEHLTDCTTSHWIRADHVSPPASRARGDGLPGRDGAHLRCPEGLPRIHEADII
ncbi:LysR substrate-binding domain-containing protein [Streptomyces sp. NPDC048751]|uniref:LysR substrate-binding domain-containing protein n=1 Tax=Streptomyces sp. NPDC048751 TaxID=3365591 RepID=UPI003714F994